MLTPLLPMAFSQTSGTELSGSKGLLMAVITCSGILIVFVILLLLIFIFYAYGGVFKAVTSAKDKRSAAKKAAEADLKPAQTGAAAPSATPEPADDGEVPGEIIAVIAAAVAAMSGGGKYAVKKVSRSKLQTGARNAWAASGIYENTRPF